MIDPSVSPDVYADIATRHRWSIRYVLDTHVHADHLSRARELSTQTGAALVLPPQDRVTFTYRAIADHERVLVGNAILSAIHTPGHTGESTSYLLDQAAVFTGDTLFTNSVARPDLLADREAARQRARVLFASLARLRALDPSIVVLPAHASEPIAFDGRPIAAHMGDVEKWLSGWLASEAEFIERVTSNLPPTPPNFVRIVELNEAGDCPTRDAPELEAGANRCAVR